MLPKIKTALSIVGLIVLSTILLLFFLFNSLLTYEYFNLKINSQPIADAELKILESKRWALEKEISYKENICQIRNKLPNESSEPIYVGITYYDEKIPITTDLNPYPEYSTISEVGIVQSSSPIDIGTSTKKIRCYRIELLSNPNIYKEYISDKDNPYIYILKDSNSSEFLLYPIITRNIAQIDTDYFIIIDNSSIKIP